MLGVGASETNKMREILIHTYIEKRSKQGI